jgi:SM-20-related protein
MEDQLDYISQAIYQNSYVVVDNFVDESYRKALLKEQTNLLNQGQFKKAAVGKGDQKQVRAEIRSDEVLWMDPTALSPLQVVFWEKIEELKQVLNRRCFLGLKSFEGHFARYPVGSFYKRHLDQFHAVPHRIETDPSGAVSCRTPPHRDGDLVPQRLLDRSRWGTVADVFSSGRWK